jgi:transcriptional regulator with PAS, ATPase and Fis domain
MAGNGYYMGLLMNDMPPVPHVNEVGDEVEQQAVHPHHRAKITVEKIAIATAMFSAGWSAQAVASALECSISAAYELRKKSEPNTVGEPRQPYVPRKRGRKPQPQVTNTRRQMVKNILSTEPDVQQVAVAERLPMPVHQTTICRDIKAIGLTRKRLQIVPFERNTPQNIQRRRTFAETLYGIPDNQLVFLDETGHNLHLSSTYGYSAAGQPAVRFQNANRGRNLTGK